MNKGARRILGVLVGVFLLCYLAYQAFSALYVSTRAETVMPYSVYDTVEAQGMVFREETLITGKETGGYLYYTATNGSRVAKGGRIALVYGTEADALRQEEISRLEEEIALLRNARTQGLASKLDLQAIQEQIRAGAARLARGVYTGEEVDYRAVHTQLLSLLNKQQVTVGKVADFDGRIGALEARKLALEAQFTPARQTVTSGVPGYFVSRADGLENLCPPEAVPSLEVAELKELMARQPAAVPADCLGKVARDYSWYLACVMPLDKVREIAVGQQLNVAFPFVSGEAVPMEVTAVNTGREEAVVVFMCSQMSEALSGLRLEEVQVRLREHAGLRVPDEALHFRQEPDGDGRSVQVPGVYIQVGNVMQFRRVRVVYHNANDRYSLCVSREEEERAREERRVAGETKEALDKAFALASQLETYDDVIVSGKGLRDGKMMR